MAVLKQIDLNLTHEENILSLVHHTFPAAVGLIDLENYTFVATALEGDLEFNSTLTVTAKETAGLTGTVDIKYNRFVFNIPDFDAPADLDLDAPAAGSELAWILNNTVRTEEVLSGEKNGIEYTCTAPADSLLYIGGGKIFVPDPLPPLSEIITGDALDGFSHEGIIEIA